MKRVDISTLKADLDGVMERVKKGDSLVIVDRDIPVVELRPYEKKSALIIRKPVRKLTLPESGIKTDIDPLAYLQEDRDRR